MTAAYWLQAAVWAVLATVVVRAVRHAIDRRGDRGRRTR